MMINEAAATPQTEQKFAKVTSGSVCLVQNLLYGSFFFLFYKISDYMHYYAVLLKKNLFILFNRIKIHGIFD